MSRIQYDASTALGSLIAKAVNNITEADYQLTRFNRSFKRMDKDYAENYLSLDDYEGMKNTVNKLLEILQSNEFLDCIFNIDQG